MRIRSALGATVLFVAASCAHAPEGPADLLEQAANQPAAQRTARSQALAAFDAFLVHGDIARAHQATTDALTKDPREPYAQIAQLVLAQHDGHPERAVRAALDLCRSAPHHPLSVIAARLIG